MLLVALTGGAIALISWVSRENTVRYLSKRVIDSTARRTTVELDRFFDAVEKQALVGKGWASRDTLDPTDHEALNKVFVPILEQRPHLSSMMVADSSGVEYLLLRDALNPDVWHNRVVRADEWGKRVYNRMWNAATGEVTEGFGELDYDPRRRIWYTEALTTTTNRPVAWTDPVIFFVTKDPGTTASTHIVLPGAAGEASRTVVVAFDLLLLDVSRFTTRLDVGENGKAFVLYDQGDEGGLRVVGLPRDPRYSDDKALRDALTFVPSDAAVADSAARLPTIDEVGVPAVARSVRAWTAGGRPSQAFEFRHRGETWFAGMLPYRVGHKTYWIGVLVPEADVASGIHSQDTLLLALLLSILVIGLMRATTMARRFGEPIESLVRQTERMSAGDLETSEPIPSRIREIRRLAEAQDEMREALASQKRLEKIENDLEVAREIQRGLLPTARPDTPGYIVDGWSKPADQTGGDYFDWMAQLDGRTMITLADATGHGIGPALLVSACRSYIRAAASGDEVAVAEAVTSVNRLLAEDITEGRFITAVVCMLNHETHELRMISAGHAPLLFYHAQTGKLDNWPSDDVPLGIIDSIQFASPRSIHFEPGDALVLVTDGFFEWINADNEQYGVERLEAFIRDNVHLPPRDFMDALHADVLAFAQGTPQMDDLTIVLVKRLDDSARDTQQG